MTPKKEEILYLRETKGLTREQIAEHYDVSLATVRRWIRDMNIPRPSRQARNRQSATTPRESVIIAEPDDGENVMEKAQRILGDRLKEKRGYGYILDGRPASVSTIVKTAGLKMKDE